MDASCSKCYKTFEVEQQTKHHNEEVEELFFTCPHCEAHYTMFFTDEEVRMLQGKIRRQMKNLGNVAPGGTYDVLDRKINQTQAEIKRQMDHLKQRWGNQEVVE